MKLINQVAESVLWGGVAVVLFVSFMAVGGMLLPTPGKLYAAAVEKDRSEADQVRGAEMMMLVSKG